MTHSDNSKYHHQRTMDNGIKPPVQTTNDDNTMADTERHRKAFLKQCERMHCNDPDQTLLRVDNEDGMLSDAGTHSSWKP
jgi:hypothetical protein